MTKKDLKKCYSQEQHDVEQEIIDLELDALNKYFKGDVSGYLEIWSKDNFSYFDAGTKERTDSYEAVKQFLENVVEGKMHADEYDFHAPRVQMKGDTAVLTYQLHADTSFIEMHYNVIEVFQRNNTGEWKVIHSTWSLITPFSPDVKKPKVMV